MRVPFSSRVKEAGLTVRLVLALGCLLGMNLSVSAEERRPNVLLIISDDQRPDTIAALGNRHIVTPHLDRLAREGTVMTQATCGNPLCVPSRAELLSGLTSFRNGFFTTSGLRPEVVTWPEFMRQAGYRTAYVGKWHTRGRPTTRGYDEVAGLFSSGRAPATPQLDRNGEPVTGYVGWQFQDANGKLQPDRGIGLTPNISEDFADAAIGLLEAKHEHPFFIHVNFTAPHDPLFVPTGYEGRYDPSQIPLPPNFRAEHPFDHGNARGRDEMLWPSPRTEAALRDELAVYYSVITHLDEQVGRILSALDRSNLASSTLVIFASDHGLAIGSHGLRGKQNMYEHTINVPLILRGPGIPANSRRDTPCYLRDLFPTVCELVKLPAPRLDGRSFAPALHHPEAEVHPFVVGYFGDSQRMIRQNGWKLILYPKVDRQQLFHVAEDPHEIRDRSDEPDQRSRVVHLREQLEAWLRDQES